MKSITQFPPTIFLDTLAGGEQLPLKVEVELALTATESRPLGYCAPLGFRFRLIFLASRRAHTHTHTHSCVQCVVQWSGKQSGEFGRFKAKIVKIVPLQQVPAIHKEIYVYKKMLLALALALRNST